MLHDRDHKNLWHATATPAPATTALSCDLTADVTIVGGGYTGLSAALHAAEAGLKAVVLEAREIGHGGSGRNVGLVNAGLWIMPNDLVAKLGQDRGTRLIEALGNGPALVFELIERFGIDCESLNNGSLHLGVGASGLKELQERESQWRALGAPVSLLDKNATAELVGSHAFEGALLDKRAGAIQPLSYAHGLAHAALSLGAAIHTQSPVHSASREGDCWKVKTASGSVTSPWLINATNAYSRLVPGFAFEDQQKELTLLPFFQLATAPLPGDMARRILPERHACWDTRTVLTSLRMDRAGRMIFGGVGALDGPSAATQKAFTRRTIQKLFPFIGTIRFEHFWHGQIGMTDDALPKFHRYGPNAVGVNGFNGRGLAPGTVFGKALARMIAHGEDMILPEADLGREPLSGAKTAFYKMGSHVSHMLAARF